MSAVDERLDSQGGSLAERIDVHGEEELSGLLGGHGDALVVGHLGVGGAREDDPQAWELTRERGDLVRHSEGYVLLENALGG
ncbi:MAG: hypothetical protein NTX23_05060 [Candidatus Bipolaricaulota bacterium]|nr:hypothetical protein [Candidatus Bipolaricaulota bacterium]